MIRRIPGGSVPLLSFKKNRCFFTPVVLHNQQEGAYKGKVFILQVYVEMGDNMEIGEAALGICFPLKAYSSYPMHPVPHLSHLFLLLEKL